MLDEAEENLHRWFVRIDFFGRIGYSGPETDCVFGNCLTLLREIKFEWRIGYDKIKMANRPIRFTMPRPQQSVALHNVLDGGCQIVENQV